LVRKMIGKAGVGMLLALMAGATGGAAPATQPGLAQDAANLGSADFAVRQAATRRLWQAGPAAEPVLKAATTSDNPETAERSLTLLKYIDDGIVPSTPPEIIRVLNTYKVSFNDVERNALVGQLRDAGTDGVRVLLRLREHTSPQDRNAIELALRKSPRLAVALLLYEGDRAGAEALLDPHAAEDDTLAYWLLRGKAHDEIETYRRQADGKLLSRLEWADGQVGPAMHDARESGNPDLVRGWMVLQADWPGLAKQGQSEPQAQTPLTLGTKALICRFAGDTTAADKFLAAIRSSGNAAPNGNQPDDNGVGVALCMNDRPDEAALEWAELGMRSQAVELYESQLRYKQMMALIDHDPTDPDAVRLQAESAGVLDFLGEHALADHAMTQSANANSALHDVSVSGTLCQSAFQMHRTKDVTAYLLDALARDADADNWLLDMANVPNPSAATWWWRCLRDREDPAAALQTVESVAGHHASKEEAIKLARTLDDWSQSQPAAAQPEIAKAIVAAMKLGDAPDEAMLSVIRDHAEAFGSVEMFVELGDALADRHEWAAAANAYGRAVELDPGQPVPVLLQGWALTQAGDTDAGKAQIELAHLLPLGDMQLRLEVFSAAHDRGLTAEADRERKLMFSLGEPGTTPMIELLRISADDAEKAKGYALAERYMQQELVSAAYAPGGIANQLAFLELPGHIHRLSAMASLAAHQPDVAMPEATVYYKDLPDDVDGLIALVRLADDTGATKQAGTIFKLGYDSYVSLTRDYPQSGGLHNQLAWAESRCRRNLDNSLSEAKRAVELDPQSTASLDTLAEAYYQLHDFQKAVDLSKHCIELDPDTPMFRDRLARFQLGLKTGATDNE
jgi:tetratricopeptide (TPR) repeat protein